MFQEPMMLVTLPLLALHRKQPRPGPVLSAVVLMLYPLAVDTDASPVRLEILLSSLC
jgi:hypothetical protein